MCPADLPRADPVALGCALRRVANVGPYFSVSLGRAPDGPVWQPVGLLHDPTGQEPLAGLIDAVRARIGHPERRVAASLLFQGFAARLWSPVLATVAAARLVPELDPDALRWRYVDGQPINLHLAHPSGWQAGEDDDAAIDYAYRTVLVDNLAPLAEALGRVVPISPQVLWGNAASALAGSAGMLAGSAGVLADAAGRDGASIVRGAHRFATTLLERSALRGTGVWEHAEGRELPTFRRRSCCLYYRVPGGGTCGDCVLASGRA